MKFRYQFIHFECMTDEDWLCRNNRDNSILGGVMWYRPWKQFVFSAETDAVFSHSCLTDIAEFVKTANKESK